MNKTVSINISGILFHIDENAYTHLNDYLSQLSSYFKNKDGGEEILTDIQSRMAELFQQKISSSKQIISLNDVNEVIALMGKPEAFMNDGDTESIYENTVHDRPQKGYRRIFRDLDDKVLGGVCSGIGNYFGFDPLWLRILFAILFFGFGTGLLLYILLWIIIPKAKTTADRLEMKGEKVNIHNIEKAIKEELNQLKNKYSGNSANVKGVFQKIIDFFFQLIQLAFRSIVAVMAVLILFIGCVLLLCILSFLWNNDFIFSVNNNGISAYPINSLMLNFFDNSQSLIFFKTGVALFLGISSLFLVFQGFKIIFKLKKPHKAFKITALSIWIIGLIMCLISVQKSSSQFSQKYIQKSMVPVLDKASVFYIDATVSNLNNEFNIDLEEEDDNYNYGEEDLTEEKILGWGGWLLNYDDEKYFYGSPFLDIVKGDSDSIELHIQKSSRGSSVQNARTLVNAINYSFSQNDSSIILSSLFNVEKKNKWRNQRLNLILKVPVGKTIYLSDKLVFMIRNAENVSDTRSKKMLRHKWMMTENGLVSLDYIGY